MTSYTFEVGRTYPHYTDRARGIRETYLCTARDGDTVTLAEQGGKGRIFKGTAAKAMTYDGFNECLRIGTVRDGSLAIADYVVAHDFLEGSE